MARRYRRRRKYTWFPNLGLDVHSDNEPHKKVSGVNFNLLVEPPSSTTFARAIIPLTFDQPKSEAEITEDTTLSELQGSAWALRRVVGNIQCAWGWVNAAAGAPPQTPAVLVGAALAVIPWDEYSNTPEADVNPLLAEDINEPWIWRKTCILGAQQINSAYSSNSTVNALLSFPVNTSFYPQSRFEYVDQRTMRTVSGDERLCLIVSAAQITPAPEPTDEPTVFGYFDYRLLGALRRRRNRGGTVN